MNKTVSMVMLVSGAALLTYGVIASNSFSSEVSRFFQGTPTDKAVWMVIGGLVMGIVGLMGVLRTARKT